MLRTVLLFSCVLLTGGCYRYVPTGGAPTVSAGTDVEVELTDAGVVDLAHLLGPNTTTIRGRLKATEADTLRLAVGSITKRRGDEEFWSGEAVAVPRVDVATVRVRRVSATRSALFGLGVAAGAFLIRTLVTEVLGPGGGDPPNPPPGQ